MTNDGWERSEKTPDEIDDLVDAFCPPYRLYEKFTSMTDEDIRTMANECGDTYEFAKEVVDISLCWGEHEASERLQDRIEFEREFDCVANLLALRRNYVG